MKAAFLTSLFIILLLAGSVNAQLEYSVNVELEESGKSSVKLIITFPNPEKNLNFTIKGRVENFNVESNAGSVSCNLNSGVITFVYCNMNLTPEKRTVYINYETRDFVKISEKSYFDGDFGLGRETAGMAVAVTLPEGMVPVKEMEGVFPSGAYVSWDIYGRKLTLTWSLSDISADQVLRFQILYERLQPSSKIWYIIIFIGIAAIIGGVAVFFIRRTRKTQEVILSVLDEFERKVMDVIIASGGVVNQRKVVQETNLSKAKVSRVVKTLVERGLVEVERLGRANKLKIIKKKILP